MDISVRSGCLCNICDYVRNTEEKLSALEAKLRAIEEETGQKISKGCPKVVFSVAAEEGGAHGPFSADVNLRYNSLITNIGDAYSPSSGNFVAPVGGVYYFNFFYRAEGKHPSGLMLCKNYNVVLRSTDSRASYDSADTGGNAVFLELEKGDRVCVRLPAGSHVWAADRHTTFSGLLVR